MIRIDLEQILWMNTVEPTHETFESIFVDMKVGVYRKVSRKSRRI